MDEQIEAGRVAAVAAGFTVTPATGQDGRELFQLFDAGGNYLATHTSEAGLWKRAFKRGLLPVA